MRFDDLQLLSSSSEAWLPLADAIAKATFVLIAAAFASFLLRRGSAATRHAVWALGLVGALVLPALSLALPRWEVPLIRIQSQAAPVELPPSDNAPIAPPAIRRVTPGASMAGDEAARVPAAPTTSAATAAPRVAVTWPAALFFVWAAGAAIVLGRLALGMIAVLVMSRRTERVADAPWLPLARQLATGIGITRRVSFLRSRSATMPMAWGLVRAAVLMPAEADSWPAERLRVVLLHELAHVKRRDCLTHAVAQIACALYWFNPLAWIAARHVRTERERACDDLVLAAGTRGSEYAAQLLEIARAMRAGRFPAVLAGATLAMAHRSQLEGRLMAILDTNIRRSEAGRVRTAACTAFLAAGLLPLASVQPWAHAAVTVERPMNPHALQSTAIPAAKPSSDTAQQAVSGGVQGGVQGGVPQGVARGVVGGVAEGVAGGVAGGITGGIAGGVVEHALEAVAGAIDQNPNPNPKPEPESESQPQSQPEPEPEPESQLRLAGARRRMADARWREEARGSASRRGIDRGAQRHRQGRP